MVDRVFAIPGWRVLAAFVIAPGLTSFLVATISVWQMGMAEYGLFPGVLGVTAGLGMTFAYPVTIILGVPAYFILHGRVPPSALNCAGAGALITILPWILYGLADYVYYGRAFWGDGLFELGLVSCASGGLGGLMFWAIATAGIGGRADCQG